MATMKEDLTLKYQTTKDGDEEQTSFASGDEVTVVETWSRHFLIRDSDGHYYNVQKDKVSVD